ncbi:hypothetical protein OS493_037986, partial [Desmophyllum pertusum]
MEMEKELRRRIAQEGFEISFNPPGDGNCFYRAGWRSSLDFSQRILHKRIFDYLEGHQFDNQGNDRLAFLCEVDLGGQKVPATWSVALKILQKNYANSDDNYVKVVEPQSGASIGTLYFGHSGYHYVALKPKQQKISSYAAAVKSSSSIPKSFQKLKWKIVHHMKTNKISSYAAAVKSSSSIPKVIPKLSGRLFPHETTKISSYAAVVKSSSSIPKVITKIKVED